ncbi:hypothetical protein ACQY0O_004259 [Thecaphora frezii]
MWTMLFSTAGALGLYGLYSKAKQRHNEKYQLSQQMQAAQPQSQAAAASMAGTGIGLGAAGQVMDPKTGHQILIEPNTGKAYDAITGDWVDLSTIPGLQTPTDAASGGTNAAGATYPATNLALGGAGGVVYPGAGSGTLGAAAAGGAVIPATLSPGAISSATVPPNTVQPNMVQPNTVQPNMVPPNMVQPNTVQPNMVQPNTVQPNTVQPNMVQPSYGQLVSPTSGLTKRQSDASTDADETDEDQPLHHQEKRGLGVEPGAWGKLFPGVSPAK